MSDGIYAAQVSNGTVRAVHIDQERIELEAMNRKVQRRLDKAVADKRSAAQTAAKQKKAVDRLANQSLKLAIALAVLAALAYFGLVNWILAAVVVAVGLIAFGSKLGRMAEKAQKKN